MKDIKEKLSPLIKRLDQFDAETVMAITGIALLFSLFSGVHHTLAVSTGIVIGLALKRHVS